VTRPRSTPTPTEEDKANVRRARVRAAPTHCTALISDSWPVNVCTALPVLMSHTFAVASQAPDTNRLAFGASDMLRDQRPGQINPAQPTPRATLVETHLMTSPV
jgi:hypothetical protein